LLSVSDPLETGGGYEREGEREEVSLKYNINKEYKMNKYNQEQIVKQDGKTFIFAKQSFNERYYKEIEWLDDTYYRFVSHKLHFLV
jgi:hypothetical protein